MTFIVGMIVASCVAATFFAIGWGCCMAMLAPTREESETAPDADALREETVSRLTPTIPARAMTGEEIAAALTDTLNRRRLQTIGVNGSLAKALETYPH